VREKLEKIFVRNFVCQQPEPRLEAWKFSTIVLGGTAALHAYRAWGAVIFFRGRISACFFLLVITLLLDCA
jgi:hypothetical protein